MFIQNLIEICLFALAACEQIVCRSFPVSTLTKEKKMSPQYLAHIDLHLQEAIQLRSCIFQVSNKIGMSEQLKSLILLITTC
jgi:myotubularin-related protein 5/13